jgi:hypothetical protein
MKWKCEATITHPLEKLNLTDKQGNQLAIQKCSHVGPLQNQPVPYPYMHAPWPSQVSFQTTNSADTSSDKLQAKPPCAIKYPPISDWLATLDHDANCGKDSLNYSQYAHALCENGIS